nr:immunoglobulin heavy chain junction region [Mus musculus]
CASPGVYYDYDSYAMDYW